MATASNKNRMIWSRVLMGVAIIAAFATTSSVWQEGSVPYETCEFIGAVLTTIAGVGRIYTTAFIGGVKNKDLITIGPYSTVRNPLYFYSLVGVAGIGFISVELTMAVILFVGFYLIYGGVIAREEQFLAEKFGQDFLDYKARTPRLLPDIKKWHCPEELPFQPKYLTYAVWDGIWWFAPFHLIEFAKWLQENGVTPLIHLP